MSNPINHNPYKVCRTNGVIHIYFRETENGTVSSDRIAVNLEALLNDAYNNGIQTERKQRHEIIEKNLDIGNQYVSQPQIPCLIHQNGYFKDDCPECNKSPNESQT